MDREVIELFNKILRINVDSLNNGKYFCRDNNFYNNIEFLIDMFDKYIELLDRIGVNDYLSYRYKPVYLSREEIEKLCHDVFFVY